jgi:S-formylglutathione hydrolase FrmB
MGSIVEHRVESPALLNLQGDAQARRVLIYLPPSYREDLDRRFPVLYLLHAFGAGPDDWLGTAQGYEGLNVAQTLDSLVLSGEVAELIVVMPDARTSLGGSWYTSSPTSGRWEEFLADDLVGYVDREFRTWKDRRQRSIVGQSMGGYGALRIAMRRPDVFSVVVGISPIPVANPNPLGEAGMRVALSADQESLSDESVLARVLWSRAAAFSPAPDLPPAFARLPYREENGDLILIPEVWDLWERATLSRLAEAHASGLRELAIRLEV